MRQITIKYEGECKRCGNLLEIGQCAMYEKSMGCFCIGCEPKDVEDIRHFRQLKADRKANKYDEWAAKREKKAEAQLNSYPSIRHDWAFITQPGHIPFRAKMNAADDKAIESLKVAEGMRDKAESLRHVAVKGDAERRYQAMRDRNDTLISKGSMVYDAVFGEGQVIGVFKKSYRIQFKSKVSPDKPFICARDKHFVRLIKTEKITRPDTL